MEKFGKFMTILLAMIISPIISGFVFFKLWAWFIVPIFQIQSLRFIEAVAIVFFIGFIRAKYREENPEDFWDNLGKRMTFLVVLACFTLLFGWIIKLFL